MTREFLQLHLVAKIKMHVLKYITILKPITKFVMKERSVKTVDQKCFKCRKER